MEYRGNSMNIDVGRLQKLRFKTAKFLEKERFRSYIACREVVEWRYVKISKRIHARCGAKLVGDNRILSWRTWYHKRGVRQNYLASILGIVHYWHNRSYCGSIFSLS